MANYNKEMYGYGCRRSVIRDLFEFGKMRRQEVGEENVFDFSLGNPSVPSPDSVNETIKYLIDTQSSISLHGYTSAQGDKSTRRKIADNINSRFGAGLSPDDIYMTCGAAAALCICFRALGCENDEFIINAPYFPEYKVFIRAAGGKVVTVPFIEENFQIDMAAFREAITPHTKAVVINSPNNPCGVIYTKETLKEMCCILEEKSARYGHPIYIVSDEPYREIVYDDIEVPYIMNLYRNTLVCYSFSKSLSIPGERIGYVAVCPRAEDAAGVYAAVCGAGRALGYVCAPSLMQKLLAFVAGESPDINAYRENRDLIYGSLSEMGFRCIHPDGAFYMFIKSLEPDSNEFSERAKQFGLLLVPADDFGAPGYVRISYCVSNDMIHRSLPAFRKLFESYR